MRARSVVMEDHQALDTLITIHGGIRARILDCTYNEGRIWKKATIKPTKTMDIDSTFKVDVVGDFTRMPFPNESFDVIVFDPPHLTKAASSKKSSKMWERRFGLTAHGKGREGDDICDLFEPFLKEAQRVCTENGVVIAKICDMVHNHKYRWQHIEFILEAQRLGWTACDMIVKVMANGGPDSSKWKTVKHVRRAHSFWIVLRNSDRCER